MKRPQFTSSFTALLAIAGAAIGLGNVWRFPYMMGSYGGSAFLLVYLLFIVLFAIPALVAEWSLGRMARGGSVVAFCYALGGTWGRVVGYIVVTGAIVSTSYYVVIVGSVGYSAWFSVMHGFGAENLGQFSDGLADGSISYAIALATLAGIVYVTHKGINQGIEKFSNAIVPFFFIVMLYLIYSTFQLPGSTAQFIAYMKPDFHSLNGTSIFAALGQAVFSMGLGGTVMLVYGSYFPDDARLFRSAVAATVADTGAALMAALFLFPTMLVFGVDPQEGPALLFETLPRLFGQMAGGRILGSFFLLALFLVAFLTGLAIFEVIVSSISDDAAKNHLSRGKCIVLFGLVEAAMITLPSFKPGAIAVLDLIFGSAMLATGSTLAVVALTWLVKRNQVFAQFRLGPIRANLVYYWLKFVLPVVFITILLGLFLSKG